MNDTVFTIPTTINAKAFRNFALFDNLQLRRMWRSPLIFAAILTFFAAICFALQQRTPQAAMLGTVLLAVGFGLPAFYFLNFLRSIRLQSKRMKLDKQARVAYTLTISAAQGVSILAGGQQTNHAWSELFGAYRLPGCIYLYAAANRAYLLPEQQIEGGSADALWALLQASLPADAQPRVRDCRKNA